MKKLLSVLLLVLCLLLTACTTPTGTTTGTQNPEDPNAGGNNSGADTPLIDQATAVKDPIAVLNQATANATKDWAADDAELADIIRETLAGGSISAHLSGDTLLSMIGMEGVEALDATWYTEGLTENALVMTTTVDGVEQPVRIWVNEEAIIFNAMLQEGDTAETAYKLNLSDLADEAWLMELADLFAQYSADIPTSDELAVMLDSLRASADMGNVGFDTEWIMQSIATLTPTVSMEGKELVISYALTVDEVATLLKNALVNAELTDDQAAYICTMMEMEIVTAEELVTTLTTTIDSAVTSIKESADIDCAFKMSVNAYTAKLSSIVLDARITDRESKEAVTLHMSYAFSDTGLSYTFRATAPDGSIMSIAMTYARVLTGDTVTYSVGVTLTEDEETMELKASYAYNKANGEFDAAVSFKDAETDEALSLGGKITKTADSASIALTELGAGDVAIKFDASLTFTKGVAVPAAPTQTTDLKAITPEQWEVILENLGLTKFVEIWEDYEWYDEATDTTVFLSFYGTEILVTITEGGESVSDWVSFTISNDGMLILEELNPGFLAGTMFEAPVSIVFGEDSLLIDGKTFVLIPNEGSDDVPGDGVDYTGTVLSGSYTLSMVDVTVIYTFEENYLTATVDGEVIGEGIYEVVGSEIILYTSENGVVDTEGDPASFSMGEGYIVIDGMLMTLMSTE